MHPIARAIRARGGFLRRRDLLRIGYFDAHIRAELANGRIFRVRHGWYSVPDAPPTAILAVRVGGRLTGIAAIETYGLRVPKRTAIDVCVPRGACRLRSPLSRHERLSDDEPVITHWTGPPRYSTDPAVWRVSLDEALLLVLATEPRDIAVACCSAVARYKGWPPARMDAVFAKAPQRVQKWRELVCALDDSHGETFVRLWLTDARVPWQSQPRVDGVGRLDGRVSPHVYVEVDGGQHDPEWTGEGASTYENDHDRDTTMAILGNSVQRYTYRQLYSDWPRCLAAIQRARRDDLELIARRQRHPSPPRSLNRKRRRSARDGPLNGASLA
ncbi:MAG: hypothetical protein JWR36_740 [Glaciihabitans sp.]|nr:hypothetical protein [Glaciihabitans sp.]